jgi:fatty-acid peroxygenase
MKHFPPFILRDSSIALRRDPYRFISRKCRDRHANAFETRLMLEPALCITGREAAAHFYGRDLFTREGAAPRFLRRTLFGEGGVQGLDGERHLRRKELFLELVGPAEVPRIIGHVRDRLRAFAASPPEGRFRLQDAFEAILTEAVCDWAGVPLRDSVVWKRTELLAALFDLAVSTIPGHLRSRRARGEAGAWIGGLIRDVRSRTRVVPPDTPLSRVAHWTEPDGTELPVETAAVEMLNVLRPVVAVSAYATFAAHALHSCPESRARLEAGGDSYLRSFVDEVRRFYPFFPLVVARARVDHRFDGCQVPAGRLVALDLYGTNRDSGIWQEPDEFRPERFLPMEPDPFVLIPQGGGDHRTNHRCPGEWFTRAIMAEAAHWLACDVAWEIPSDTDTTLDFAALPGLPKDRMTVSGLRPADARSNGRGSLNPARFRDVSGHLA